MIRKAINYLVIIILLFSYSISLIYAEKPGTCKNPSGGNYCNQKNQVSDCYCDNICTNYGDCCSDYKEVCTATTEVCPQIAPPLKKEGCTYTPKYENKCIVGYDEVCESSKPILCPAIVKPVCGADGKTYGNSCQATVAGVKVACEGECPCKAKITKQDVINWINANCYTAPTSTDSVTGAVIKKAPIIIS